MIEGQKRGEGNQQTESQTATLPVPLVASRAVVEETLVALHVESGSNGCCDGGGSVDVRDCSGCGIVVVE